MKNITYLVFIVLFTFFGCVGLTPYQELQEEKKLKGGYSSARISGESNKFSLTYYGNRITPLSNVIELWKRRAGELCPNGYVEEWRTAKIELTEVPTGAFEPEKGSSIEAEVENAVIDLPVVEGEIVCR